MRKKVGCGIVLAALLAAAWMLRPGPWRSPLT